MNGLCEFFEDFSDQRAAIHINAPGLDEAELESQRLAAFEQGYKAGWDDADKAQARNGAQLSAGVAQSVNALSLTAEEATKHVMATVTPLFEELVGVLLPDFARETLGLHIAQAIQDLNHVIGQTVVEIVVAPDAVDAIRQVVADTVNHPVTILADPSLTPDQADLRFGTSERQIDLGELMQTLKEAVAGFAHDNRRSLAHG